MPPNLTPEDRERMRRRLDEARNQLEYISGTPTSSITAVYIKTSDLASLLDALDAAERKIEDRKERMARLERDLERSESAIRDYRGKLVAWSTVATALGVSGPEEALTRVTALIKALRDYISKCPWCDDNGKQGGYVGYELFRFDCVHCGWARAALAAIPATL